jgi:hypothetical protein
LAKVRISVPEDLKKRMESMDNVNWSDVARKAFEETLRRVSKSEQTTADLAGSGAKKARVSEMKRLLDGMRSEDT